ncbi:hypothetical protein Tco_0489978 [Tanacetum coccineum]
MPILMEEMLYRHNVCIAPGLSNQEIEDHLNVTLTSVNPDGQQQSSSVSSGFVSNMLNPNQDTSVDAIFGHNVEATFLVDIPVTAIAEPSFFAPTNHPPTPNPLFTYFNKTPNPDTGYTFQVPHSKIFLTFGFFVGFGLQINALEDQLSDSQTNKSIC